MKQDEFSKSRKEFAGKPVEELLRLLESDDLRSRFLAEMCLRDTTGT